MVSEERTVSTEPYAIIDADYFCLFLVLLAEIGIVTVDASTGACVLRGLMVDIANLYGVGCFLKQLRKRDILWKGLDVNIFQVLLMPAMTTDYALLFFDHY